jgi:hypothetical protein
MRLVFIFISLIITQLIIGQKAFITHYETHIELKADKKITTQRVRIKVNNPQGDYLSTVRIPYDNLTKLNINYALLEDANNNVLKTLKKSEIISRSSISGVSFFQDDYEKMFRLKHYKYPYYIDYEYEYETKTFITICNWLPVFSTDVPTISATLVIENNSGYKIKSKLYNIPNSSLQLNNENLHMYKTSFVNTIDDEIYSPNPYNSLPRIVVIPERFYYHNHGSLKTWQDYGLWESSLLEGKNDLTDNEKKIISELTYGINDSIQLLKVVYQYLQNKTRYINISIETGGHVPHPASYVCTNSYGDCKALTNYLKTVYEYLKIQSYYTIIYSGIYPIQLDTSFVYPQFNHVILCVPLKNDTIWLDCTSDGPFNYLSSYNQNRIAYIVNGENSSFVRTPAFSVEDVKNQTVSRLKIDNSNLNINASLLFGGREYDILSNVEHYNNDDDFKEFIFHNFETNGLTIDSFSVRNNLSEKQYQIKMKGIVRNKITNLESEIFIGSIRNFLPTLTSPKNRENDLFLAYPINRNDSIIIEKPLNSVFAHNKIDTTLQTKFGHYKFKIEEDKNFIYISKSLVLFSGGYPKEAYSEFYDFINNALSFEKKHPNVLKTNYHE